MSIIQQCATVTHVLGHPCLVSLLFIPSLYATFLNSKKFLFTCLLFLLHNCAWVLVQKCIRFCGKRTQHRQVIDINNITTLLPEAVCCCLQICHFCFDEILSEYISVPSFVTKGHSIGKL